MGNCVLHVNYSKQVLEVPKKVFRRLKLYPVPKPLTQLGFIDSNQIKSFFFCNRLTAQHGWPYILL